MYNDTDWILAEYIEVCQSMDYLRFFNLNHCMLLHIETEWKLISQSLVMAGGRYW